MQTNTAIEQLITRLIEIHDNDGQPMDGFAQLAAYNHYVQKLKKATTPKSNEDATDVQIVDQI